MTSLLVKVWHHFRCLPKHLSTQNYPGFNNLSVMLGLWPQIFLRIEAGLTKNKIKFWREKLSKEQLFEAALSININITLKRYHESSFNYDRLCDKCLRFYMTLCNHLRCDIKHSYNVNFIFIKVVSKLCLANAGFSLNNVSVGW